MLCSSRLRTFTLLLLKPALVPSAYDLSRRTQGPSNLPHTSGHYAISCGQMQERQPLWQATAPFLWPPTICQKSIQDSLQICSHREPMTSVPGSIKIKTTIAHPPVTWWHSKNGPCHLGPAPPAGPRSPCRARAGAPAGAGRRCPGLSRRSDAPTLRKAALRCTSLRGFLLWGAKPQTRGWCSVHAWSDCSWMCSYFPCSLCFISTRRSNMADGKWLALVRVRRTASSRSLPKLLCNPNGSKAVRPTCMKRKI